LLIPATGSLELALLTWSSLKYEWLAGAVFEGTLPSLWCSLCHLYAVPLVRVHLDNDDQMTYALYILILFVINPHWVR
jgi:hypothetical protein